MTQIAQWTIATPATVNPPGNNLKNRDKSKSREAWVDILKGLGIVLVVMGHALGGLIDADAANAKNWFRPTFAAIYVFHMPLFFFLSGLFVAPRLERGKARFARALVPSIVWPYLLWSIIQVTIIWAAGTLVNHPGGAIGRSLLAVFYWPPSQFWFLYGLLLLHLAALAAGRIVRDPAFLVLAFGAASLGELSFVPGLAKIILYGAPYYALGVVLGPRLSALPPLPRLSPLHIGIVLTAPLAVALAMWNAFESHASGAWLPEAAGIAFQVNGFRKFFAAALMIAALSILARRWEALAPQALIRCGQLTMPIFLVHVICIAGTRIMLGRIVGPIDPAVLFVILIAAGISGPLIVYAVARRLGVTRLLGFG